jgi:hypothetical protein
MSGGYFILNFFFLTHSGSRRLPVVAHRLVLPGLLLATHLACLRRWGRSLVALFEMVWATSLTSLERSSHFFQR